MPSNSDGQTRLDDSLSLVGLFNSTNGSNWTNTWDLGQPMDGWFGVILTNDRVTCLDLDGLGNCSNSTSVGNNLTGNLTDLNLTNLTALYLGNNSLTGTIPNFSNLPSLNVLNLTNNQLSGDIPNFTNLANLVDLFLENNQLTGVLFDFTNLPSLSTMHLSNNQLTGSIPDYTSLQYLIYLGLSDNQLTGTIPDFTNLPFLQGISFQNNQLTGNLPLFTNADKVNSIMVSGNKLTGAIPEYAGLNITTLFLDNNKFTGGIPDFSAHTNLSYFRIENNNFTFQDIISTYPANNLVTTSNLGSYTYSPQDSIGTDTILYVNLNAPVTLELFIDDAVTTSTYTWFKDGTLLSTTTVNQLTSPNILPSDLGIYHCQVTNPNAPGLTLQSKGIQLVAECDLVLDGTLDVCAILMNNPSHPLGTEDCDNGGADNSSECASGFDPTVASDDFLVAQSRTSDSLALIEFYNATNGPDWTIPWDLSEPIDLWFGVQLYLERVIEIYTFDNNLIGTLPDLNLPKLQALDVSGNQLAGPIPDFTNLPYLQELDVSDNLYENSVPKFTNLPNLENVNTSKNQLTFSEVLSSYTHIQTLVTQNGGNYAYFPLDTTPLYGNGNQLYVKAGGTLADNTYNWYKDGLLVASNTGDSLFTPIGSGWFQCQVTNQLLPSLTINSKEAYSFSDAIVYPGDTDANGKVEASDVLYCGLAFGRSGPIRQNASTLWTPQQATDWSNSILSVNGKNQDCNGDGTIDNLDLEVIANNFDSISPAYDGPILVNPTSSDYYVELIPTKDTVVVINTQQIRQRMFDLYLKNVSGAPVTTKGLQFSFGDFSSSNNLTMHSNLDNSSLGASSDLRMVQRYDTVIQRLDAGIFTILPPTTINGPTNQIIVEELLSGFNLNPSMNKMIVGNVNLITPDIDTLKPGNGQVLYLPSDPGTNFGNPTEISAIGTVNYPDCNTLGRANVLMIDPSQYSFNWNTGATTPTITGLSPGSYSVTVSSSDPSLSPVVIQMDVPAPEGCPNELRIEAKLYLEGALDTATVMMKDALRTLSLLPLETPYGTNEKIPERLLLPSGPQGIIDWIEVELHTVTTPTRVINRTGALIRGNGEVVAIDGYSPVKLSAVGFDSVYVVLNHRNHLPVMSGPVGSNESIEIDFTRGNIVNTNSQREVIPGIWAATVGDAAKNNSIDGGDKIIWSQDNGTFNQYLKTDFNFDGEVSGADRILWETNNGVFTTHP